MGKNVAPPGPQPALANLLRDNPLAILRATTDEARRIVRTASEDVTLRLNDLERRVRESTATRGAVARATARAQQLLERIEGVEPRLDAIERRLMDVEAALHAIAVAPPEPVAPERTGHRAAALDAMLDALLGDSAEPAAVTEPLDAERSRMLPKGYRAPRDSWF
jgi:hypothetical protein